MRTKKKSQNAGRSVRLRLDPKRRGYFLNGKLREGFEDDPDLGARQRGMIARWAQHFTSSALSEAQIELLEGAGSPQVSLEQKEFLANQRELRTPYLSALFESLSPREQRLIQSPTLAGERVGDYPLSVGELSLLTEASERQIRKWADDGVLPSYREGKARRFYSAAAIRAFALARAPQHCKAIATAAARGEIGQHFQLLAATLGRVAVQMPVDIQVRLNALVEDLSSSSRLMPDVNKADELRALWSGVDFGSPLSDSAPKPTLSRQTKSPKTKARHTGRQHSKPALRVKRGIVSGGLDKTIRIEPRTIKKGSQARHGMGVEETDEILSARYGGFENPNERTFVITAPGGTGGWTNQLAGDKQGFSVHQTKNEAMERGRELARKNHGKHVLYSSDGSIATARDYGDDS
jgi:hypothetical protein